MSERDDLFEMWSRHGSSFESDSSEGYELADAILNSPWLAAREERVRAEERELCAQIAERADAQFNPFGSRSRAAAAIRAVSEQDPERSAE